MQFWQNKQKKAIQADLFSEQADGLAKKIHEDGLDERGKIKHNKPSQIRKFYDEVVRFDSRLKENQDEFSVLLPYLMMLNAKAAYAEGRGLISKSFKTFLSESLKQVKDRDDFEVFANLFEAFMGFYKFYRPSEGGSK
ncbi:MAG TPA: type III-A CRISPR-associated protein Csm2 [Dissulfurispiraceae bacterium]|nr:type III-A CRISPR-associated protein Csm2 [Dissulfurispiraceae bacterium]